MGQDDLHHYTSGGALQAIVKRKKLRATNLRYLNDSQEFLYVYHRTIDQLLRVPTQGAPEGFLGLSPTLSGEIQANLIATIFDKALPRETDRYVVCFTE